MSFTVDQIKAYLRSSYSYSKPTLVEPAVDQAMADKLREELADDLSEASQDLRKLSPDVAYIELNASAGELACGNCSFLRSDGVFCAQAQVRGNVSAENGHCNYFKIDDDSKVVFPPKPGQQYQHVGDSEDDEQGEAEHDAAAEHEEEDREEDEA